MPDAAAAAGCIFVILMIPLLTVNKKQQAIIKIEINAFVPKNEFVKPTAPVTMDAAAIEKGEIIIHHLQYRLHPKI